MISFIVFVVAPTSVVLLLIFVEEMHREWALIPYASHLLLDQVPSVIVLGPVAWNGLLFIFATRVAALCFVRAMAVHQPSHIDTKGEPWLPYRVAEIYCIDAMRQTRVSFELDVARTGCLRGADELGFTDGLQLIVFLLVIRREILVRDLFLRHLGCRC